MYTTYEEIINDIEGFYDYLDKFVEVDTDNGMEL